MSPKWVVMFDWDGTLIDSLEIKIANAAHLFEASFGVPAEQVKAAYRRHSGVPRRQLFALICRESGLPELDETRFEQLSQRFTALNLAAMSGAQAQELVSPDTRSTLQTLASRGYPLYVSSAADPGEIRKIARAVGLESYFQDILGSLPGFGKGRQHVEHVLQEQHAQRQAVVFIGDDPADIDLGHAAGVLAIAKAGTFPPERLAERQPDHIIFSLSELLPILEQRNPN